MSTGMQEHLQKILKTKDIKERTYLLKAEHVCGHIYWGGYAAPAYWWRHWHRSSAIFCWHRTHTYASHATQEKPSCGRAFAFVRLPALPRNQHAAGSAAGESYSAVRKIHRQ